MKQDKLDLLKNALNGFVNAFADVLDEDDDTATTITTTKTSFKVANHSKKDTVAQNETDYDDDDEDYDDDFEDDYDDCNCEECQRERFEQSRETLLNDLQTLANRAGGVDWNNLKSSKWFFYFNHKTKTLMIDKYKYQNRYGAIYFPSQESIEDAINRVGVDNINKYLFNYIAD